ncbi:PfkB family carbohydrate kinase [Phycisphaerales bacterium AB-hyl4]|uniref:PfkB family carbohydrate kinase n=1 Tax=Natronomicrosphaera hydrolytica TaxID=3242702 RepID=A0ABV4U307_9BACT
MPDRAEIARSAAAGLRQFAAAAAATPVLIGFDGFVDSIIKVVDKRHDLDRYDAIATIADFGGRISAAAGQSANFEMVTTLQKLGGNGPIMGNAMAAAGLKIRYVGALGEPTIHEVFEPFAEHAEVYSVVEPGYTDALEFADGKLMLGKYESVANLDCEQIHAAIGRDKFDQLVTSSRLIGMVNWTMLPKQETIWCDLIERVLPNAPATVDGRRRMIFIDLADPAKRTTDDLKHALSMCSKLNKLADVVLGMNLKEAGQVAAVLGVAIDGDAEAAIQSTAADIRETLGLHCVVVHPRRGAAAARLGDDGKTVSTAAFYGPFVANPKLSTGAGDNFNAGFCLGLLADLTVEQALCTGTATSGYYVRNGASPALDQLAVFCDALPSPEQ